MNKLPTIKADFLEAGFERIADAAAHEHVVVGRVGVAVQGDKALATAEERAELSCDLQSQARFSDPGSTDQC